MGSTMCNTYSIPFCLTNLNTEVAGCVFVNNIELSLVGMST